ncbi:FHA domain-containing protein [bacterium]|nr:FHA domain-containing protein [bacterium]
MSDPFPSDDGHPLSLPEVFAVACGMTGPLPFHATHRQSGVQKTFTLTQPFALAGRDPSMPVRLEDPSVSQCHAYIQVVDGRPYCVDLGSRTGVIWDDGSRGRGWLLPDRPIRVGAFDLVTGGVPGLPPADTCPEGVPADAADADLAPTLEVFLAGGAPAGRHLVDRQVTLVGRHPNCQVRFADNSIGYFHCALVNTRDGVWCVDVLNRKGTRVNGRVARLTRVRDGDLIEIGKVSMCFREGGSGHLATVWGAPAPRAAEAPAPLSRQTAESVTAALIPIREMMEQFQQCFVTMAGMFAAQQQEHAALVCEQMRLIQDLAKDLRELRSRQPGEAASTPPAPPTATASTPPRPTYPQPTQRVAEGADAQALTDGHSWFLQQLAKMGHPSGPPPGKA